MADQTIIGGNGPQIVFRSISRCVDISGRSTLQELNWWLLLTAALSVVYGVVEAGIVEVPLSVINASRVGVGWLAIATLSLFVRRAHDNDFSAAYCLVPSVLVRPNSNLFNLYGPAPIVDGQELPQGPTFSGALRGYSTEAVAERVRLIEKLHERALAGSTIAVDPALFAPDSLEMAALGLNRLQVHQYLADSEQLAELYKSAGTALAAPSAQPAQASRLPQLADVSQWLADGAWSDELTFALGPGGFREDAMMLNPIVVDQGGNAWAFPFQADNGTVSWVRISKTLSMSADQAIRYSLLEDFIDRRGRTFGLVSVRSVASCFSQDVRDEQVPGLVLEDAPGIHLDAWLEENYADARQLRAASRNLFESVIHLQQLQFAHGDLSHENIFVDDEESGDPKIRMIDYDGAYLPGAPLSTALGHPYFQHPHRRTEHWGRYMDSVSALVIHVALRAIGANPRLYDRFGGSGATLFTEGDLRAPGGTPLWEALSSIEDPSAAKPIYALSRVLQAPEPPQIAVDFLLEWGDR